ncbi:hypothetical protein [Priestia megaterium]|uniref:hypothetical protein n=1 Tax=Priestia megaterium TaxID=1404 RepID=UPI000BFE53B4|nr:hypothetical protein [Priestia megaterium]PGO60626.1 hypothetical protein CN981_08740 [Priestia megaterium]
MTMAEKTDGRKKPYTIHGTDMVLNKDNLRRILDEKSYKFKDLYDMICHQYDLDLTYNSFMGNMISNRATWKLHYAWAIVQVLHIDIPDIFDIVRINVPEKAKEKEEWKEKYQK